jgi:prepilin-type N-terminal cleavage/methylation domain-containing protein
MKNKFAVRKQNGFTMIELVIGIVIGAILMSIFLSFLSNYRFNSEVNRAATQFNNVIDAVQRRNSHDGFMYKWWDENGGSAPSGDLFKSWTDNEFSNFTSEYLIAREHPGCGVAVTGWNPINTDGTLDGGDATKMEKVALISCSLFTGQIPFRIKLSAAIDGDITGAVNKFGLYLGMDGANFRDHNVEGNNIINYMRLFKSLDSRFEDKLNGVRDVSFGTSGADLDDMTDDVRYTASECEDELIAGNKCDLIVYLDFAGSTNARDLRTSGENYMLASLAFGESIAAGRQKCLKWTEDGAGLWTSALTDCGIEGGADNSEVTLVVKNAHAENITITDSADLTHLCRVFEMSDETNDLTNLVQSSAPDDVTPCGFTQDGGVIQMAADNAQIGRAYAESVVADKIYASETSLFSTTSGATVMVVYDSTHTNVAFSIDNTGNTSMVGDLAVGGDGYFSNDVVIDNNILVNNGGVVSLNDSSTFEFGDYSGAGTGLQLRRDDGTGTFSIQATGLNFEILSDEGNIGLTMTDSDEQIKLKAPGGVVTENGTKFHSSFSSFKNELFDTVNGINTDDEKALSELVTYDLARYLDDTSAPIQIVGIDKVQGEYTVITKPDCLAFTKDSAYSSAAANPYSGMVLPSGESIARLVLTPIFFKTYNSAFGDNQLVAQHGIHSSSTTWDVYLYLSGEGAFSTGAREDGAGASLAITVCDYAGINFPRKPL